MTMNKKTRLKFIFIFAMVFGTVYPSFALAKPAPPQKQKDSLCDVMLERIKEKREFYANQNKQINKKILEIEKQQAQLEKASMNKKYSEKEFEKAVKKKDDLENQISSLVVSLADIQNKIAAADIFIEEYQKRKEQVDLSLELESELGTDKKFQVKKRTREEINANAIREKYPDADKAEYNISPHDELQINVYGEPDLTKTVRVAADGTISYPLLGRVKVERLTAQSLEEKLGKLLSDNGYIVNPQVSVYVERFSSISILGEVRNPGSYELKGKLSIMDAIAQAGGFNIDADINNVKILRYEENQQKTIQVRLGDLKKGIEGTEIALRPNDTIFVEKIGKVTVLGEVTRPGTFELKDKLTVLEAIAMAGGFTNIAAINSTRIIREPPSGSKKKVIKINVRDVISRGKRERDIELLAGDIIYVPESLF